jgi:hypothetical protein
MPLRVGELARREIALFELGHEPGSFEEPLPEQAPLRGRKPSPKREYLRAAAVVKKEQRRERRGR